MNANELADDMENGKFNDANYNRKKAADFVRQQQAEIDGRQNSMNALFGALTEMIAEIKELKAKTLTNEVYFCSRCGKRLGDGIHTCTPPTDILRKAQEK